MRILLDTHAFIWWLAGSDRLPIAARHVIGSASNETFVSAASAWEIATKRRIGKLHGVDALADNVSIAIAGEGFKELPITVDDAVRAGSLPGPHRDPFDRMLIAQALAHHLVLISTEAIFDGYGIRRLWEIAFS